MASSSSSSNKGMHSIYAALDSHQYNRVIKLCLAQPKTHTLSRALLAHGYAKAGQRYKALCTLQEIFGKDAFPELQLEIKYSLSFSLAGGGEKKSQEQQQQQAAAPKKPPGKKGKKKGSAQPQPAAVQTSSATEDWDLIDQLDTPPVLPENWEQMLPAKQGPLTPDPTLMGTLSVTMTSILKLPLTAYQLYCWATTAAASSNDEVLYTRKAYLTGLSVLLAPQYNHIVQTILSNLQVLALQLARLQQRIPATLWASQTAVWQIEFQNDCSVNNDIEKQKQRMAMLPRLAESLAAKCVEEYRHQDSNDNNSSDRTLLATESFLLYMRTLDLQGKWDEKLEALEQRLSIDTTQQQQQQQQTSSPPRQNLLEIKVKTLQNIGDRTIEMKRCLEELLEQFPDDWEYWRQYLEVCMVESDGDMERGCAATEALIAQVLANHQGRYPLRGPHLMRVELVAASVRAINANDGEAVVSKLIDAMITYGNEFASRAHCVFSDLCPYLELCLERCLLDQARQLLKWSSELRSDEPSSDDMKERGKELCVYIFAVKVNFKILSKFTELRDSELPTWEELVKVWRSFQILENSMNVDQAQKESRLADELILLAVQIILHEKPGDKERLIAACLLEAAIRDSPYNAYLKISAMFVYAELHAMSRCWDLYNDLNIKHIQNESCAYLILPLLRSGGCYREIIQVCQEILALQRSSGREAADFSVRAMESGTVSKAKEFIVFHRNRMLKSLTTLEAKGLILDCAPLLIPDEDQGEIGIGYGIVGGDSDLERVKQMIEEAHNPAGAISLLDDFTGSRFSDNRDFGILSFEILSKREFDNDELILRESSRRRHQHRLLTRAALCIDATKGPKKGKASKPTPELERRCKSLLKAVDDATDSFDAECQPLGYGKLFLAMLDMCRTIIVLSTGMNEKGELVHDTLDAREEAVVFALQRACESLQIARNQIEKDLSISKSCRLLSDCAVPVFAFFQMCARIIDMFGWGPRKRKTKRCAGAVADLSLSLARLIADMKACLSVLPIEEDMLFEQGILGMHAGLIDVSEFKETSNFVHESQEWTRCRMETILEYVMSRLDAFDVDE